VSVLAAILANKRKEVDAMKAAITRAARGPHATRSPIDVVDALRRPGALRLIAEVKFRSPSAGALSSALDAATRAHAYASSGAAMVSILCDRAFFDGSFEHLAAARTRLDAQELATPLLAKEFVIDEVQIEEARAHGADAVLLIARIVSRARLAELANAARAAGLEPFIEVSDEPELDAAMLAGARVVGVNARDLDTLVMDAARAARILARVPAECVAVHLSGLRSATDVADVARGRADAALVGEILMREDDPRAVLTSFVRAAFREGPRG
jgi:indole-3-glycerol phosphate synthase